MLLLCDGTRSALAIQAELGDHVDVPADTYPERRLRDLIDQIGDPALRERQLAKLRVLKSARDRAAAGGDSDALVAAFAALVTDFTELTRAAGGDVVADRLEPSYLQTRTCCTRAPTATHGSVRETAV